MVKEYVKGFIASVVGVIIVVSVLPTLINTTNAISGDVPILASSIVGTVAGAGVILFLLDTFL